MAGLRQPPVTFPAILALANNANDTIRVEIELSLVKLASVLPIIYIVCYLDIRWYIQI